MKNFTSVLLLFLFSGFSAGAQGYKISVQSNYNAGVAYLTYYMGKDRMLQDSAVVNAKGLAVFAGQKALTPGIYSLIFPGKRLSVDVLVDRGTQEFFVKADSSKLEQTIITGSPANLQFSTYRKYVDSKGRQLDAARKGYNESSTAADSARFEAEYKKLNGELNAYREKMITDYPGSMIAVLLSAMKEPAVPSTVAKTRADSIANYFYYKSHYWDGIDFMDERVVRTPFFLPRLETYFRQVVAQSADSLNREIDYRLLYARSNPEMYKFMLNWLTDEYFNPKYMGQDAVFVHLFEKYHSKGLTNWLNEKQKETITRRAYMVMANLIGEPAADPAFTDRKGANLHLYDVPANFTFLVFWDPTCGHCKQELPRIDSFYRAVWKNKGVKIFAVLSEDEKMKAGWEQFITDHHLEDWTHVYQSAQANKEREAANLPSFKQLFDITSTPTFYLLDKDKRIVAKKLSLEQFNDFINVKSAKP